MYGTETPPAIDAVVNTDGNLNINEAPAVEIQGNAIDNDSPPRAWTGDSEVSENSSNYRNWGILIFKSSFTDQKGHV